VSGRFLAEIARDEGGDVKKAAGGPRTEAQRRMVGSGSVQRGVVALAALALVGCAGTMLVPAPADFPLHATIQQFDLSWRLTHGPEVTQATGVVARRNENISDVWLQLVGLDAGAHVVSFSAMTWVRWASPWDAESFTLTLRPAGTEERFEVRVKSFSYQEGAPTMG
jgi:hypothetical protein